MALQLTVNGNTYNYPQTGDSPPWGDDATAWADAVTAVLSSLLGAGDIIETPATIANNQSSAANVLGLSFDPATVRGAIVEYSVYRTTTGVGATELVEVGQMFLAYKNTAATWEMSVVGTGGAGVTFSITSAGQIQYTSTNITGSTYSGTMKFKARALRQ